MKTTAMFTLSFIFFLCAAHTNAQKVYYHSSYFERTFTKCEHPPSFGKDSLALQQYFSEKLEKEIGHLNGQIKISLFIDSTGKTSCEYVDNYTKLNLNKTPLNIMVDEMPYWNIGYQNGRAINCVGVIVLTFEKNNFIARFTMGRDTHLN